MTDVECPSDKQMGTQQELPRWYPKWKGKPWFNGEPAALAFSFDVAARGFVFATTSTFLATALLRLAKEAAGCETDPLPGESTVRECHGRVMGIRPSSLLTTYSAVVGVFSALLMPLLGAVVDYTPHRRLVGRYSAAIYCFLIASQVFLFKETWILVTFAQILVSTAHWCGTTLSYAYLPEMSDNESVVHSFTSTFTMFQFGSMVVFLGLIVGIASPLGVTDEVGISRLGSACAFFGSSLLLFLAWRLYPERDRARPLPEGQALWNAGFIQVYRTTKTIFREFPRVRWFYLGVGFSDAAIISLPTIAITFMTDTLQFTSTENGIAILILLVSAVPGALFAKIFCSRCSSNLTYSVMLATAILTINSVVVAIVITKPGQQAIAFCMAFGWGLGMGWKWTSDKALAGTLIPKGQEAELMGMFIFASQSLTWLPPAIFTIMNEKNANQRISIGCIAVYFFIAVICYYLIGDQTVKDVEATTTKKASDETDVMECAIGSLGLGDGALSREDSRLDDAVERSLEDSFHTVPVGGKKESRGSFS